MKNLPWILIAFCVPLLGTGLFLSSRNLQLDEDFLRLQQREQKLQKQLLDLEPSDAQKNRELRERLDSVEKEVLQTEALVRAGALFAPRERIGIREASASRSELGLAPNLRKLLEPIPSDLPASARFQREAERLLLESLLQLSVEQVDHLEVHSNMEEGSADFPFQATPIQIRYRIPREENWKVLSSFLANLGSNPAFYLRSLRFRTSNQDKKQEIVDLSLLGLFPY